MFWRDEEFRWFVRIVLSFTLLFIVMTIAVRSVDWVSQEQLLALGGENPDFLTVLRMSFFHVMTIISSGGFQAEYFDYDAWGMLFWQPTFVLMMCGGCAGSTAGGMKVVRAAVFVKSIKSDFTRMLHPRQVSIVKLNGRPVPTSVIYKVMAMFAIYVILIFLMNFILQMLGLDIESAFGTAISAFSNTGPGLGLTGPAFTWASVPDAGKWLLAFAMLMGRLEIFTLLIVFTPLFWRKY
jgi:trk system potassium uptake protein TrkH